MQHPYLLIPLKHTGLVSLILLSLILPVLLFIILIPNHEGDNIHLHLRRDEARQEIIITPSKPADLLALSSWQDFVDIKDIQTINELHVSLDDLTDHQIQLSLGTNGERLALDLSSSTIDLAIVYDQVKESLRLDTGGDLNLTTVKIAGPLTINLTGNKTKKLTAGPLTAAAITLTGGNLDDCLFFNGPMRATTYVVINTDSEVMINASVDAPYGFANASAGLILNGTINVSNDTITLQADRLSLVESQLHTGGDLKLLADNDIVIRDSADHPFIAQIGGNLYLEGQQSIDILALNHPESALISGGEMRLRSENSIRGEAHYLSGGQFTLEQLAGHR